MKPLPKLPMRLPWLSNLLIELAVKLVEYRFPAKSKAMPLSSELPVVVSSVSSNVPVLLKCLIFPLPTPAKTSPTWYATPLALAVWIAGLSPTIYMSIPISITTRTTQGVLTLLRDMVFPPFSTDVDEILLARTNYLRVGRPAREWALDASISRIGSELRPRRSK